MTRQQKIRRECFLQLYGAGGLAISAGHIQRVMGKNDLRAGEAEVVSQLRELVADGCAERRDDLVSGERRWAITTEGQTVWENGTEG